MTPGPPSAWEAAIDLCHVTVEGASSAAGPDVAIEVGLARKHAHDTRAMKLVFSSLPPLKPSRVLGYVFVCIKFPTGD
ncbi:hypothetical protein C0Q70_07606 [Pomacea canaliculata]|uniref:Uncharacterized protein n=1 Tax=Pomacea canaliculata TaxID=400727 RepID=A0A2T7PFI0_POMCA|nr:hypothetical protein C0Q70_07606 [Pomacea canaliculata]